MVDVYRIQILFTGAAEALHGYMRRWMFGVKDFVAVFLLGVEAWMGSRAPFVSE